MKTVLSTKALAAQEAIAELAGRVHDPLELLEEVRLRTERIIAHDGGCWMLTDPQTVLPTGFIGNSDDAELTRAFMEHEFFVPDVNVFSDLHRRGIEVITLDEATGGRPELSARYRDIHVPKGLGAEVRVLCRAGGATWGVACFGRSAEEPEYSPEEIAWLRAIAPEVGRGLRAALAHGPASRAPAWAPGMLVLDAAGHVEYTTGAADRWLAHMPAVTMAAELHPSILGVAMQARAEALAAAPGVESPAQARLRVDTGAWLYIHAAALRDASGAPVRTAVMLEPADRSQLLPLLTHVHGLTAREHAVTELLLNGTTTDCVAKRLGISRHTVRDHVKAIFAKVGVGSRAELTARFQPAFA
jgi:DNA-binding CsgD family transcriptional regulator